LGKVLIIGAGPAGLTAAVTGSSKYDLNITLVEKDSPEILPTKPCGEAVPRSVFNLLPRDIGHDFILNYISRAILYFDGEPVFEFKRKDLVDGYTIDKHIFLVNLAEVAESRGVKIVWNKTIKQSDFSDIMDEYDLIVDASGKGTISRIFLDYSNYNVIPAIQAYAKGSDLDDDAIIIWGIDRGYAWIFPRGDLFNVGIGGEYKDTKFLIKMLNNVLEKFNLKIVSPVKGGAISAGGPLKRISNGKVRAIGEAAGAVMPTTGEGIRFAIEMGSIVFEDDFEKIFWKSVGWKLKNGARLLKWLLKFKNKKSLAKTAGENAYYAFFEGLYGRKDLLKLGLKYLLKKFLKN